MSSIVFNHFPQLSKALGLAMEDIVGETCKAIIDRSNDSVPVRTGHLKESARVAVEGTNGIAGYDDFKAVWNEYGTSGPTGHAAQPFLTPAAEAERSKFDAAVRSLEPRLSGTIATGHWKVPK